MKTKHSLLTVQSIKFLEIKDKTYEVPDIPGLFLRIYPSGKKVWKMNKSINGERIVKTLGAYPKDLSIAEARQKVKEYAEQSSAKNSLSTFENVYKNWIEIKKNRVRNWKQIASRFQRVLLPSLGKELWKDITPLMMVNTIKQNTPAKYNYSIIAGEVVNLETYAINMGIVDQLKFRALKKALPTYENKHHASISPDCLPTFLKDLIELPIKYERKMKHYFVFFLFCTLLRIRSQAYLKWEYIDFKNQVITIPANLMKTKREHTIPITTQMNKVLNALEHTSEYVFTSNPRSLVLRIELLFEKVSEKTYKVVPHGVRAIGRTWMGENEIDFEVAENCLAHKVGNSVVQAYYRTTLLEKRRVAMQKWNDYVEKCFKDAGFCIE